MKFLAFILVFLLLFNSQKTQAMETQGERNRVVLGAALAFSALSIALTYGSVHLLECKQDLLHVTVLNLDNCNVSRILNSCNCLSTIMSCGFILICYCMILRNRAIREELNS